MNVLKEQSKTSRKSKYETPIKNSLPLMTESSNSFYKTKSELFRTKSRFSSGVRDMKFTDLVLNRNISPKATYYENFNIGLNSTGLLKNSFSKTFTSDIDKARCKTEQTMDMSKTMIRLSKNDPSLSFQLDLSHNP